MAKTMFKGSLAYMEIKRRISSFVDKHKMKALSLMRLWNPESREMYLIKFIMEEELVDT